VGRNLPAAIGVGVLLGGLALLTLLTVKGRSLSTWASCSRSACTSLTPRSRPGHPHSGHPRLPRRAAVLTSAYWAAGGAVTAALALTLVAVLGWRLPGAPRAT